MKTSLRAATGLAGALCLLALQMACYAQSTGLTTERAPVPSRSDSEVQGAGALPLLVEKSAEKPLDPPTVEGSPAIPDSSALALNPSPSVATPPTNDAIIKELAEMKARIAQLEAELKARDGASVAERDAN